MKRWQTLLLLFLVAFLPYSVALLTGQQLGPTEHIQTMVTPDAPKPNYGWDILQADGVLQFLPWRDLVFESWAKGEAPILNPYQLAGQPLTANSQSGGFYPLHILFAFVPASTGTKIILLGILHLFIAAGGTYLLLRNLKASQGASLIGATAFALSQFMVAWAPLASVPSTVAWIPLILAGIVSADIKKGFFLTSLATAMMLLAGHLQFAFYGLFAAFLMWIWVSFRDRKATALIPLVALGVGALVSYPQLSLVLKNSQTSHRKNIPTEEGYAGYSRGVITPYEALSFINPKLLGDPQVKTADFNEPNIPTGYWSLITKLGANPAECALWISPIVLTLVFLGLGIKRRKESDDSTIVPGVLLAVLGVLLAFGSPLNKLLFFNAPGWSATGSPGRAHVLIVLGLCLLGAIGYDRLQAKNDGSKKWLAIALVPLLLLGIGFNVMNMLGGILGQPGDDTLAKVISATTKPHLPGIALSALLSSVVLLALLSKKLPSFAAIPAVLIALTLIGQRPLSGKPLEMPKLDIPAQDRTVFVSQEWNMARTPKAYMPPNMASLVRVHDLFGYDSILNAGFVNKLQTALGISPAPQENGNMMFLRLKDGEALGQDASSALSQMGVTQKDVAGGRFFEPPTDSVIDLDDPTKPIATVDYDGYDHQLLSMQTGVKELLLRDRYFEGMTSPTPGVTIENKDGWRLIKTDGTQLVIRIDYPGRKNYLGVIIGIAILLLGYFFTTRKNEPNPTAS